MKLAIMKPYFFPYIGYFQLVNAVDLFVLYDTAQFIKGGWINRNRILAQGREQFITVPVKRDALSTTIDRKEIALDRWPFHRRKLLKQIHQAYSKAPFFQRVFPLVEQCICYEEPGLSRFVCHSVEMVARGLGISTELTESSRLDIDHDLMGQDKVLAICDVLGATEYINAIGGMDLYRHSDFAARNVLLSFIKSEDIVYRQFVHDCVSWLSIIDVMMFNSHKAISHMLGMYELIQAT